VPSLSATRSDRWQKRRFCVRDAVEFQLTDRMLINQIFHLAFSPIRVMVRRVAVYYCGNNGENRMKTQFTNDQIKKVMQERGCTRKSALRRLNRNLVNRKAATHDRVVDVKKAAANDAEEIPVVKLPARNASLVAKGAAYHVLAGRPSKQAIVACFGKSGYALSWVSRAERLGISPQELCESFRTNPAHVADQWATLGSK